MPTHYDYKCTQCKKTERRYRNVKRCRRCRGDLERIEPPTYDELAAELDEARGAIATAVKRLSAAYDDTDIHRGMNAVGEIHDDLTLLLPLED